MPGATAPDRDSPRAYLIGPGKWFDLTHPAALHFTYMPLFGLGFQPPR